MFSNLIELVYNWNKNRITSKYSLRLWAIIEKGHKYQSFMVLFDLIELAKHRLYPDAPAMMLHCSWILQRKLLNVPIKYIGTSSHHFYMGNKRLEAQERFYLCKQNKNTCASHICQTSDENKNGNCTLYEPYGFFYMISLHRRVCIKLQRCLDFVKKSLQVESLK